MHQQHDHKERMSLLQDALWGVAVGDGFGERFFVDPGVVEQLVAERVLPAAPWGVTDDTVMACGIAACLLSHGEIVEDELAQTYALNYSTDMYRGYGGTAHSILRNICLGQSWQEAASEPFSGTGSMGNGGAMRAAPLGAYFFDEPARVVSEARKSARVTHWHPEGQAGAIAIALAASWAVQARRATPQQDLFTYVLTHMPDCDLKVRIAKAQALSPNVDVRTATAALGNGSQIIALDTVPFTLWCAAKYMEDFEEAMWLTVSGLGDRDTTCAIVGGIVAARLGRDAIPSKWRASVEDLGDAFSWSSIMSPVTS